MTTNQPSTFQTRFETRTERMEAIREKWREPMEVLRKASAEHESRMARLDAMLKKLDATIERMDNSGGGNDNDK